MDANLVAGVLKKALGAEIRELYISRKRKVTAEIPAPSIKPAAEALVKNDARLIIIAAVDSGLDIELLYHFDVGGTIAVLKVNLPKESPEIESIVEVVPAAEWAEREAMELAGAKFIGHPNPTHLMLRPDWQEGNFPLAKPFKRLPDEVAPVAESIATSGTTAPMTEIMERKRIEAGLSPKPPMSYSIEAQVKELHEMLEGAGFPKRAGYDMGKKKLRGVKK